MVGRLAELRCCLTLESWDFTRLFACAKTLAPSNFGSCDIHFDILKTCLEVPWLVLHQEKQSYTIKTSLMLIRPTKKSKNYGTHRYATNLLNLIGRGQVGQGPSQA